MLVMPIYGKNVQGPITDALLETMFCKTTDRRCAMYELKHGSRVVSDDAPSFLPRFIQRCIVGTRGNFETAESMAAGRFIFGASAFAAAFAFAFVFPLPLAFAPFFADGTTVDSSSSKSSSSSSSPPSASLSMFAAFFEDFSRTIAFFFPSATKLSHCSTWPLLHPSCQDAHL